MTVETRNKTVCILYIYLFVCIFFGEMGNVSMQFPVRTNTSTTAALSFPPEIARSLATSCTLILHRRKFFSLLAFFLAASGVYYHARTAKSRDTNTGSCCLSFVPVKRVICNVAGKFVENPSDESVQPFRACFWLATTVVSISLASFYFSFFFFFQEQLDIV